MKQRILSLLLAAALLCTILPQITLFAHAEKYSGTCGENLTWSFDSKTGTLTIKGSGTMENYSDSLASRPWNDIITDITQVSLPTGITSIGLFAFAGCTGLKSINFPAGLTSIGMYAFNGCTGLTDVTFPKGLTSIGYIAFRGCTGLTKINLPEGLNVIYSETFADCTGLTEVNFPNTLTEIHPLAFDHCTGLKTINFPKSVTFIGNSAFSNCTGLTAFQIAADNPNYCVDDCGVLFNKNKTELIAYPCGRSGSYTIPNSVLHMYTQVFKDCIGLTEVTISAKLTTEISHYDFEGCTALSAFHVAEGNPNYSTDAYGVLFNKDKTALIIYPCGRTGSYAIPDSVTSFAWGAFEDCIKLTKVTFPAGLTSIVESAFRGCIGLTELSFPEGLTSINDYAFFGCTGLTELSFPAGLTSIGNWAFSDCIGLTAFHVAESNPMFSTDDCGVLLNKEKTELILYPFGRSGNYTIPDSVKFIQNWAFYDCTMLTGIAFSEGLNSIGNYAFQGCTGLTHVVLPKNITEIGSQAFGYLDWENRIPGFTIYGYAGTTAQTYATQNGFIFLPLDPESGFCDVEPGRFYYNPMLWALKNGITNGTSQVRFSPAASCTRAQVVTFLWRAMGEPKAKSSDHPFTDVAKGSYYYKAMLWALENGITTGTSATQFSPNVPCSRAQVVTFLHRTMGEPEPTVTEHPFTDVEEGTFYYRAMLWAYENGVTKGTDESHFSPHAVCNRGQVVTFLYNLPRE